MTKQGSDKPADNQHMSIRLHGCQEMDAWVDDGMHEDE